MSANAPRILIAAGGTGGHLIPALHVARAMREINPHCKILFLGSGRPLERKLIPEAGFELEVVELRAVKGMGGVGAMKFLLSLPASISKIKAILKDFKPSVILGMGGYVSFLPVTLARLRGIPAWIHEAEWHPGLANGVLATYASRISVVFPGAGLSKLKKALVTGHPVRSDLGDVAAQPVPGVISKILLIGGSQGAQALDSAMLKLAPFLKTRGIKLRHQCRSESRAALEEGYARAEFDAEISEFITDMKEAYAWCDLVISRAGASAIMEIEAINKPAILIPYPYAQAGHQLVNARYLQQQGKALIVEEGHGFEEELKQAISKLLVPSQYADIKVKESAKRTVRAAEVIAKGCFELASAAASRI
ncbi:MAG: hypothetical protein DCC75_02335 [Proteobacteria bacterium]|nr:MAG: hypothetical protein DCC75_02335 [Pseudomonadota bacterium]